MGAKGIARTAPIGLAAPALVQPVEAKKSGFLGYRLSGPTSPIPHVGLSHVSSSTRVAVSNGTPKAFATSKTKNPVPPREMLRARFRDLSLITLRR